MTVCGYYQLLVASSLLRCEYSTVVATGTVRTVVASGIYTLTATATSLLLPSPVQQHVHLVLLVPA